jgi:hypothetical protein
MSSHHDQALRLQQNRSSGAPVRGWRSIRPRRPTSVLGWLMWLLVVLVFYLLISNVLVPWWYRPVPTNIPPATQSGTDKTSLAGAQVVRRNAEQTRGLKQIQLLRRLLAKCFAA